MLLKIFTTTGRKFNSLSKLHVPIVFLDLYFQVFGKQARCSGPQINPNTVHWQLED